MLFFFTSKQRRMMQQQFTPFVVIILLLLNVVAFLAYGIDKYKARHNKWRIPESTLIGLAVIGGSVGALAGMYAFRHKTQHAKFKYGLPIILILQLLLLSFCSCSTWRQAYDRGREQEQQWQERRHPQPPQQRPIGDADLYSPSTLIIHYDAAIGKQPLFHAVKKRKAEVVYDYRSFNAIAIRLHKNDNIHKAMEQLKKVKGVLQVSRDRKVQLH